VNDDELKTLTSRELCELRDQVEVAIRAAIRAKRSKPAASPTTAPAPSIDLERERDAWLSAKRQRGSAL